MEDIGHVARSDIESHAAHARFSSSDEFIRRRGWLSSSRDGNSAGRDVNGWILEITGWDDGAHEAGLRERAARLGLDGSVTWTGPLFGRAKASALQRASAFILPSYSEGLPMALLEAWAYSKPVLMTLQCNLPEGFIGAAIRIEPNSDSIARGLDRLTGLADTELNEMGSRGRQLVRGKVCMAACRR